MSSRPRFPGKLFSKTMRSGARSTFVFAAACGLVAIGFGVGLIFTPEPAPSSILPNETTAVAVEPDEFDDPRVVSVGVELTDGIDLQLLDGGRVTASSCAPGWTLSSGSSPLTIDNRPAIALATAQPLWRDLKRGMSGTDVAALESELVRLGYAVEADANFGRSTSIAVESLLTAAGWPTGSMTLPASSVVWMPEPSTVVEECKVHLGDNFSGGSVASTAPRLSSVQILAGLDGSLPGDRILEFDAATGAVDEAGRVTEPSFLDSVARSPEFATATAPGADQRLRMTSRLREVTTAYSVPPAALFGLSGHRGCVIDNGESVLVEVLTSSLGRTIVRPVRDNVITQVDLAPRSGQTCE